MIDGERATRPPASWWARHAHPRKTTFRVLLGTAWLIDGIRKFTPGYGGDFLSDVRASQQNSPRWLSGGYSFGASQAANHGPFIVYTVSGLERTLGVARIFGILRKVADSGASCRPSGSGRSPRGSADRIRVARGRPTSGPA